MQREAPTISRQRRTCSTTVSGLPMKVVGRAPVVTAARFSPAMLRESSVATASRTPARIENGAWFGCARNSAWAASSVSATSMFAR